MGPGRGGEEEEEGKKPRHSPPQGLPEAEAGHDLGPKEVRPGEDEPRGPEGQGEGGVGKAEVGLVELRRGRQVGVEDAEDAPQSQGVKPRPPVPKDEEGPFPQGSEAQGTAGLLGEGLPEAPAPKEGEEAEEGGQGVGGPGAQGEEGHPQGRGQNGGHHEDEKGVGEAPGHGLTAVAVADAGGDADAEACGEEALDEPGREEEGKARGGHGSQGREAEAKKRPPQDLPPPQGVHEGAPEELAQGEAQEVEAHHELGRGGARAVAVGGGLEGGEHDVYAEGPKGHEGAEEEELLQGSHPGPRYHKGPVIRLEPDQGLDSSLEPVLEVAGKGLEGHRLGHQGLHPHPPLPQVGGASLAVHCRPPGGLIRRGSCAPPRG